jgi:dTDP-4-amino-4,6-dideoxygalactose transaminase
VPSPSWKIVLSDLAVDDELLEAAHEAVASGWWSMGPRVSEFETEFARFCGVDHGLAMANGTAALHVALLAVGCGPGDEVVVPSLNFVAAANVISHTGATPVFCDIVGEHDLTLDPEDLQRAVGPRTKAIVVMHYGGWSCDMDRILAIARRYDLAVIEDAAHAPGGTWRGRNCGALGDIGCFSFFSNKNLPVGEGGMAVTDDPELADRLRLLRSHGMTTLTWERHRGHANSYDVVERGFNYRLDEIRAAIGLVQLRRLPAANAARAQAATLYADALDGREGIVVPFARDALDRTSAHHLAVVVLPRGIDRDVVRAELTSQGIQTSVHYPPIHHFAEYRHSPGTRPLPRTDDVAQRILTLPLHPRLDAEAVATVSSALLQTVAAPVAA